MSSPPLSPTPRRWTPAGTSPVVEALRNLVDDPPDLPTRANSNTQSQQTNAALLPPQSSIPNITTTSPSPQRLRSTATTTAGGISTAESGTASPLTQQRTGGSLDAVYDDVYASINAFANQTFSLPPIPSVRTASSASSTSSSHYMSPPGTPTRHSPTPSPISPLSLTPPRSPTLGRTGSRGMPSGSASGPHSGYGSLSPATNSRTSRQLLARTHSADALAALGIDKCREAATASTVSGSTAGAGSVEMLRSESEGALSSNRTTDRPTASIGQTLTASDMERVSGRFPYTPKGNVVSPSKGSATPSSAPTSPRRPGAGGVSRASDLIKMFESRTEPTTTSTPTSIASSIPQFQKSERIPSKGLDEKSLPPVPSSSSGISSVPPPVPPREPAPLRAASPLRLGSPVRVPSPAKPKTPISSFRNVIASWRARTASEAMDMLPDGSTPTGSEVGLSRDRAWNVSIRRKRRDEVSPPLAERVSERSSSHPETPSPIVTPASLSTLSDRRVSDGPVQTHYSGEPIRTGILYYFNVHESDDPEDFFWVQVDARLYSEGLHITWRTENDSQAVINFDLAYCEEAGSMFSPNDPNSGDDIGAVTARRQGDLGSILCPFKLVFDDGVERFACDSARERVGWVRVLWNVLEDLRIAPGDHMRPPASVHSRASNGSGSASARFSSHRSGTKSLISDHPTFPTQTVDDAVVVTGGGFAAPLTSRNSRRLAASNSITRDRSIRRVASDMNLHDPEPMASEPLTRENAKPSRSRDFSFAQTARSRGIAPPPLPDHGPSYGRYESDETTPSTRHHDRFRSSSVTPAPDDYSSGIRSPFGGRDSPVPSTFTFGTPGLYPSDSVSNIYVHPRRPRTPPRSPTPPPPQLPTITGSSGITTPSSALNMHTDSTPSSFRTARQAFESDSGTKTGTGSSGSSTARGQTLKNLSSLTGASRFATAKGSFQQPTPAVTARGFVSTVDTKVARSTNVPTAVTAPEFSQVAPTAQTAVTAPSTLTPTAVTAPGFSDVASSTGSTAVTARDLPSEASTAGPTAVTAPSTITPWAVTAPGFSNMASTFVSASMAATAITATEGRTAITAQSTTAPTAVTTTEGGTAVTAPSALAPTAVTAPGFSTIAGTAVTAPSTLAPTAVTAQDFPSSATAVTARSTLAPTAVTAPSTTSPTMVTAGDFASQAASTTGPAFTAMSTTAPTAVTAPTFSALASSVDPAATTRSAEPTAAIPPSTVAPPASTVIARDFALAPSTLAPTAYTAPSLGPTAVTAPSNQTPSAVTAPIYSSVAPTAVTAASMAATAVTAAHYSSVAPTAVTAQTYSSKAQTAVTAPTYASVAPSAATAPSTHGPSAVTAPTYLSTAPTAVTALTHRPQQHPVELPPTRPSTPPTRSPPLSPTPSTLVRATPGRSVLSLRTALRGTGPPSPRSAVSAPSIADPSGFLRSQSPTGSTSSRVSARSDPDRPRYTLYDRPVPPSPVSSSSGFQTAYQGAPSGPSSSDPSSYNTAPSIRRGSEEGEKKEPSAIGMARASSQPASFTTAPSFATSQPNASAKGAESTIAPSQYVQTRGFEAPPSTKFQGVAAASNYVPAEPQASTQVPSDYVTARGPDSSRARSQHASERAPESSYPAPSSGPAEHTATRFTLEYPVPRGPPTAYGTASLPSEYTQASTPNSIAPTAQPPAAVGHLTKPPSTAAYTAQPPSSTTFTAQPPSSTTYTAQPPSSMPPSQPRGQYTPAPVPVHVALTGPPEFTTAPSSINQPETVKTAGAPGARAGPNTWGPGSQTSEKPFRPGVYSDVGLSTTGAMTDVSSPPSYTSSRSTDVSGPSFPSSSSGSSSSASASLFPSSLSSSTSSSTVSSLYSTAPPVPLSKSSQYSDSTVGYSTAPPIPLSKSSHYAPSTVGSAVSSAVPTYISSVGASSVSLPSHPSMPSAPTMAYVPSEYYPQSTLTSGQWDTRSASEYTAPLGPPSTRYSRSAVSSYAASEMSSAVSEPDTDHSLLAGLDRQSSAGSSASDRKRSLQDKGREKARPYTLQNVPPPPSSTGSATMKARSTVSAPSMVSFASTASPSTLTPISTYGPAPSLAPTTVASRAPTAPPSSVSLAHSAYATPASTASTMFSSLPSSIAPSTVAPVPSMYGTAPSLAPTPSVAPPSTKSSPRKLHRKAVPSLDSTPESRSIRPVSQVGSAPPPPPSSSSSATSSSIKTWIPPRRPNSTPPSRHSSSASSHSSSTRSTSTSYDSSKSSRSSSIAQNRQGRDYSMLRLVNYLQGQEQVRQGQTTRLSSQMDRVEHKVDRLERIEGKMFKLDRIEKAMGKLDTLDDKLDRLKDVVSRVSTPRRTPVGRGMSISSLASSTPPPLPSKDGHSETVDDEISDIETERPPSPALSDSSSASVETERPVTPTLPPGPVPFIVPDSLNQRLDDISNLLGTVLGQQEDILAQLDEKREIESIHGPPQMERMSYIEDMLREILHHVGNSHLPTGSIPHTPADRMASFIPSAYATPRQAHHSPAPTARRSAASTPGVRPPSIPSSVASGAPRGAAGSVAGSVAESGVESDLEGPFYPGSSSVYGLEVGMGPGAPPNSVIGGSPSLSAILPSSLLNAGIEQEPFDLNRATAGLPPAIPEPAQRRERVPVPEWLRNRQGLQEEPIDYISDEPIEEPIEFPQEPHGSEYGAGDYPEDYQGEIPYDDVDYPPQPEEMYEYHDPAHSSDGRDVTSPHIAPSPVFIPSSPSVPDSVHDAIGTPAHSTPPTPLPLKSEDPLMTFANLPPHSNRSEPAFPGHRGLGLPPPAAVDLPTPVNDRRHLPPQAHGIHGPFPSHGPRPMRVPRGPPISPHVRGIPQHVNTGRSPYTSSYVRGGFRPRSFVGTPGLGTPGLGVGGVGSYYPGMPGVVHHMPPVREEDDGEYLTTDVSRHGTPRRSRTSRPSSRHSSRYTHSAPSSHSSTTSHHSTSRPVSPSSSSSSSTVSPGTEEQLLTPIVPIQINVQPPSESDHQPPTHETPGTIPESIPGSPATPATEYWQTRMLGEQQNDMARYLHEMNDHFNERQYTLSSELREILGKIDDLRTTVRREHVYGRVLSDGRVQLATGEIVEGIRGVSDPGILPPSPEPSDNELPSVPGKILPDGTIIAGDKIVDGITADSYTAHASESDLRDLVQKMKDDEQDRKLDTLQDKIAEILSKHGSSHEPSEVGNANVPIGKSPTTRASSPRSHHSHHSSHHSVHLAHSPAPPSRSSLSSRHSPHSPHTPAKSHHTSHHITPHATPQPTHVTPEATPQTVNVTAQATPQSAHATPQPTPVAVHVTPEPSPASMHATPHITPTSLHATPHATPHTPQSHLPTAPQTGTTLSPEGHTAALQNVAPETKSPKQPVKVWSTNSAHPSRRSSPEPKDSGAVLLADVPDQKDNSDSKKTPKAASPKPLPETQLLVSEPSGDTKINTKTKENVKISSTGDPGPTSAPHGDPASTAATLPDAPVSGHGSGPATPSSQKVSLPASGPGTVSTRGSQKASLPATPESKAPIELVSASPAQSASNLPKDTDKPKTPSEAGSVPSTPTKKGKGKTVAFAEDSKDQKGDPKGAEQDASTKAAEKPEDGGKGKGKEQSAASLANIASEADKKEENKAAGKAPAGDAKKESGKDGGKDAGKNVGKETAKDTGKDASKKTPVSVAAAASAPAPVPVIPTSEDEIPIYEMMTLSTGETILVKTGSMPRPKPTPAVAPTPATAPADSSKKDDKSAAKKDTAVKPVDGSKGAGKDKVSDKKDDKTSPAGATAGTPAPAAAAPLPSAMSKPATPSSTPAGKTVTLPPDDKDVDVPARPSSSASVKDVGFPAAGSIKIANPDPEPVKPVKAADAGKPKTPTATPAGGEKDKPLPTATPTGGNKDKPLSPPSTGVKKKPVPELAELSSAADVTAASSGDKPDKGEKPAKPTGDAAAVAAPGPAKDGVKPADKPAGKPSGSKPADKPETAGIKLADKPTNKLAGKPSDKPSEQPGGKPADKPADKPGAPPGGAPGPAATDAGSHAHCEHCCPNEPRLSLRPLPVPPAAKPADKPADQPANKPSDKPVDKTADKPADGQMSAKEDAKKPAEVKKSEEVQKPTEPKKDAQAVAAAEDSTPKTDKPAAGPAPKDPAAKKDEAKPGEEKAGKKSEEKDGAKKTEEKKDAAKKDDAKNTDVKDPAKEATPAAEKKDGEKKDGEKTDGKKADGGKDGAKSADDKGAKADPPTPSAEHEALLTALKDIKQVLDELVKDQKAFKEMFDNGAKEKETRRKANAERDLKVKEALDQLLKNNEDAKKLATDNLDETTNAFKQSNEEVAKHLREANTDLLSQISNYHKETQDEAKRSAKEQVAFNVQNYLEDFSKALAPEVRTLLKEVGDLRECRRGMYVELAELLLMKGRQSQGDMLAIMPYPTKPPGKPGDKKEGGGGPPGVGGGPPKDKGGKQPQAPPAWSTFNPMPAGMGQPRPLPHLPMPQPFGGAMPFNMMMPQNPPAPGAGGGDRPLPKV